MYLNLIYLTSWSNSESALSRLILEGLGTNSCSKVNGIIESHNYDVHNAYARD